MSERGSFAQDLKQVTWEWQQWQTWWVKWTLGPTSAEREPLQLLEWTLWGWRVIADALWQCGGASGKELTCQCWIHKIWVHSQGWEDPLEEEHVNPLQYSCPENPMNRGAWWATVHSVSKSQTWLKWLSTHACTVWRN